MRKMIIILGLISVISTSANANYFTGWVNQSTNGLTNWANPNTNGFKCPGYVC